MSGYQENHPDQLHVFLCPERNWWIRFLLISIAVIFRTPSIILCAEELPRSDPQAIAIMTGGLASWARANSFRAKVICIQYNDIYETVQLGTGEMGYHFSSSGYLRLDPHVIDDSNRTVTHNDRTYTVTGLSSLHWNLSGNTLKIIDRANKHYFEFQASGVDTLTLRSMRNSLVQSLLLPESLKKYINDDWTFEFTRETNQSSFVKCRSRSKTRFYNAPFTEIDLCFSKATNELTAIQLVSSSLKTVYVFSDVELNPAKWPMPDLTGYKNVSLILIE